MRSATLSGFTSVSALAGTFISVTADCCAFLAVLHPATSKPIGPDDLAPLFPFGLILIKPVFRAMNDESYKKKFVEEMNTQTIKVAGISLLVYCLLRFFGFM